MTRFWEPLSDERAGVLVKGWGTVPTERPRWAVMDVARRVDRTGRPFEALALLSAGCESATDRSAVADLAMVAAEVAANCAEPLAASAATRSRARTSSTCWRCSRMILPLRRSS